MVRWLGIAVVLLLAAPTFGQGRIPLNAASAESLRAADASCAVTVRDGGSTNQHSYVTRDCDASTDEGFVWHMRWLPGMPLTGTLTIELEVRGGSASTVCHEVALGCSAVSAGAGAADLTFGTVSSLSSTVSSTDFTTIAIGSVALPATIAADRYCGLRVIRNADASGGCADAATGDSQVRGGSIQW